MAARKAARLVWKRGKGGTGTGGRGTQINVVTRIVAAYKRGVVKVEVSRLSFNSKGELESVYTTYQPDTDLFQ